MLREVPQGDGSRDGVLWCVWCAGMSCAWVLMCSASACRVWCRDVDAVIARAVCGVHGVQACHVLKALMTLSPYAQ